MTNKIGETSGTNHDDAFESSGFVLDEPESGKGSPMEVTVPARPRPAGIDAQPHRPAAYVPTMIMPAIAPQEPPRSSRSPWSTAPMATVPASIDKAIALNSASPELAGMFVGPDISKGMSEYAGLVCHLETRSDGQIRLILNELKAYLPMMRQSQAAKVYAACPLLKNPNHFLTLLAGQYPDSQEVVPGMSLYKAAIRELGNALWLIFSTIGFKGGLEKLRDLTDGNFEYNFGNFRESLPRRDDEAAPLDSELDYWLMQLTLQEKQMVSSTWRVPPKASDMVAHLKKIYPPEYHAYVINIFANQLFLLFSHCSIEDDATPQNMKKQDGFSSFIKTSTGFLKQIWDGKYSVPDELPPTLTPARVTARVRQRFDEFDGDVSGTKSE